MVGRFATASPNAFKAFTERLQSAALSGFKPCVQLDC
jgi:hypothetical protein